jgi:vacuolar-type H+-ATPase subunit I/STV1
MSNVDETKQKILRIFPDKIDKDDTINRLNQLDWTRNLRMDQRSIFIAAKAQTKPVMTALTGVVDPKVYKAFADDNNIPDEISTKEEALYNTADKVGLSKDTMKNLNIQTERLETKDLKKQFQELILRKESISQKKENDRTKDENDFLESVDARIESIKSTLFKQRKLSKNDIEKIEKNIQKIRDYVIKLNKWLLTIPKNKTMRYADVVLFQKKLQEFLEEFDDIPDDFEGIELFIPKLIRGRFYRSDYEKVSNKKDIKTILQALAGELQDIRKEIPKTYIPKIQFNNKPLKKYYY